MRQWYERLPRKRQQGLAGYMFLLPWFIGLFFIVGGPMLGSLYLSFTDFNLRDAPEWVGLSNYDQMFNHDPRYWNSARVTFQYVFVGVPIQLTFALALALVLDKGIRGLAFYRAVYYLPSLLGASVAIALLWRRMFGGNGLINQILAIFGIQGTSWIGSPDYALWTLIALMAWQFGSPMILFLAGLRQIPREYYEAASVDGAGVMKQFLRITIPLLTPIIFFNLVLQVINAFQAFTPAYIVSGGTGGPVDSTLFYTLYLYHQGFRFFSMGYASAMAWMLLLVIALFTAANFIVSKYWVHYGDD
jgi:multiple sugar transport system permease protein